MMAAPLCKPSLAERLNLTESCRHTSRKASPNDPGELCSFGRVAENLPRTRREVARGVNRDSVQCWPILADTGQTLAKAWPILGTRWPKSVKSVRSICPISTNFGRCVILFVGRRRPKAHMPKLGRVRPTFGQIRPNVGQHRQVLV